MAGWAPRGAAGLDILGSLVDIGALSAFALLHASVVGYFVIGRKPEARLAHRLVPLFGIATTVWVIAETGQLAKIVAGVWLAAGALALWLQRPRAAPPTSATPPGR